MLHPVIPCFDTSDTGPEGSLPDRISSVHRSSVYHEMVCRVSLRLRYRDATMVHTNPISKAVWRPHGIGVYRESQWENQP